MAAQRKQERQARRTTLSGEEARQGEIILKTPTRKAVFIGGLALAAVVSVVLACLAIV